MGIRNFMGAAGAVLAVATLIFAACGGPQPASQPGTPAADMATTTESLIPAVETASAPLAGIPAATPQPEPEPGTALTWALDPPGNQGLSAEQEFFLKVDLDPMGRGVSGAQFTLYFPPDSVRVLKVVPGSLLGPEPLVIEQAGMEPGELVLAMARRGETKAPTGAGLLAEIHLKVTREDTKTDRDGGVIIRLAQVKVVDGFFQFIDNPALTGTISGLE